MLEACLEVDGGGGGRDFLDDVFQGFGQAVLLDGKGTEMMSKVADFIKRFADQFGNGFEVMGHRGRQVFFVQSKVKAVFDEREVLAEAVVQIRSQAFALLLLGGDEALSELLARKQGVRLCLAEAFLGGFSLGDVFGNPQYTDAAAEMDQFRANQNDQPLSVPVPRNDLVVPDTAMSAQLLDEPAVVGRVHQQPQLL